MYEISMEEVVREENRMLALGAVKRNRGAPAIDHMKTTVPSPVRIGTPTTGAFRDVGGQSRRVEIPKPSGGTRMLGIPDGPADSADAVAGADADLRSEVQRA